MSKELTVTLPHEPATAAEPHATKIASLLEDAKDLTVDDSEDYEAAASLLVDAKRMYRDAEALMKELTVPLKNHVKKIEAFFKPGLKKLSSCEELLKTAMIGYTDLLHEAKDELFDEMDELPVGERTQQLLALKELHPPQVAGIQRRPAWKGKVVDVSLIPAEFMMPNEKALLAAAKTGQKIPGYEAKEVDTLAVYIDKAEL